MDDAQKWAVACSRAGADRLRLAGAPARHRAHRRDPRQRHGRRAALPHRPAHRLPRVRPRSSTTRPAFAALPPAVRAAIAAEMHAPHGRPASRRSPRTPCPASWATHRRPGGQPVQLARAQLRRRRRLRLGAWPASSAADRGPGRGRLRRRLTGGIDRNMGAQTFVKFCKIGALSATGTRPYDDGADGFVMGEGAARLPAQAAGRRRARRRPHLRRAPRHRRRQRRQGQGHHRAQPGRPAARRRARLAQRRAVAGDGRPASRARHVDPGRRRRRGRELRRRVQSAGLAPRHDRPRLGEVEHRPPQGGGRAPPACSRRCSRCTTR